MHNQGYARLLPGRPARGARASTTRPSESHTRAGATRRSSSARTGARRCWPPDCPTRHARSRPSCSTASRSTPVNRAELQLYLAVGRAGPRGCRRGPGRGPGRARQLPAPGAGGGDRPGGAGGARRPGGGPGAKGRALADGGRAAGPATRGGTLGGRPGRVAARRPGRGRRGAGTTRRSCGRRPPATAAIRPGWCGPPRGSPRPRPGPARRCAGGVARLPPRPGRARRPPGHAGQHRAAGAGIGARGRAGPAGAGPRGRRPPADAAVVERAVAGDGAGPARDCDHRATGELAGLLAALRANDRRLSEARDGDEPTSMLERERARLEKAIQHRRRLVGVANGTGRSGPASTWTGWSTRSATRRSWSCSRSTVGCGRSSSPAAGSGRTTWAAPRTPPRRSTPRGSCCGRRRAAGRSGSPTSGPASRQRCSARPVAAFGTGPVVVSPTASLHATPWGLLPALAGVPVTVVPTASAWLRARGSRARGTAGCSLPGPGLAPGERRSRWWPRSTRRPWC